MVPNRAKHFMYSIKHKNGTSIYQLSKRLAIPYTTNRITWFGSLKHLPEDKWSRKILEYEITSTAIRDAQRKKGIHIGGQELELLKLDAPVVKRRERWR